MDLAFFLSGVEKGPVLEAFNPHIFFDNQDVQSRFRSRTDRKSPLPERFPPPRIQAERSMIVVRLR